MVKLNDPVLLLRDYFVITKLIHAIGSLYMCTHPYMQKRPTLILIIHVFSWETVFTAGFELNVLRGKQPYRWTIWLYLGTRYTLLLMFIVVFIHNDGHVPCQPFIIANFALSYASWGFASLIIVLRVIAIWDRHIFVSSIALSMWLAGLGVNMRTVTRIDVAYNSVLDACVVLKTQRGLASSIAILAIDTMLFVIMLIGLLRHAHGSSTGIWHLLYKQCIVWMILAAIAEMPPVVFLVLNLNDAWNEMFPGVGITILSICATRMYRSLSKEGSLTKYSSDPPQFSSRLPLSNYQGSEVHGVHSATHFATAGVAMLSDRFLAEPFVFVPGEQIQLESVPGASNTALTVPSQTKSKGMPDYQFSWHRPG